MATEFTKSIGADDSKTVVSGVTVPYVKTSDLEIYVGKGKIEEIEVTNAGAGYTNISFTGSAGTDNTKDSVPLVFSGGGGSAPTVRATVTNNQIDSKFWTDANGTEFTGSGGSDYTTAPNISISGLSGGTGGQLTAKIYAIKTSVTDYSISGTSGNATITFTSSHGDLSTGDKVLVKRATKVNTAANTFAAGAAITATDLNKSFDQIRHRVEELPEVTSTALTNGDKGDITVSGNNWTIKDNSVEHGMLTGDCIDGDNIQDDVINSEHYVAGSIDTEHVADDAITYEKMQNLTTANRVLGSTTTGLIREIVLTPDHIGDLAVTQGKIAGEAVNEAKLQISNGGSDGQYLQKQSGNTGGLTWATPKTAGSVLETFTLPCTGASATVGSGTYTTANVTAGQSVNATGGFVDLNGSSIAYTPPTGTKIVVYKFTYWAKGVGENCLWHNELYIDSAAVTKARRSPYISQDVDGSAQHYQHQHHFEWPITIRDTADASIGQLTSWSSAKTIKIQSKGYSDSYAVKFHELTYWDGSGNTDIIPPVISITAIA